MQQFQWVFIHTYIHAMIFDMGEGELCNHKSWTLSKKIFHMTMYFKILLLQIIYQSFPCQNVTNKSSNINKSNTLQSFLIQ